MRLTILIAATMSLLAAAPRKPAVHVVAIEGTRFQPDAITVKVGDVVTWENKDPFPHTATSKTAGFDSQPIAPGKRFRFTASRRGEFEYVCTLHPTMKATLRVQ